MSDIIVFIIIAILLTAVFAEKGNNASKGKHVKVIKPSQPNGEPNKRPRAKANSKRTKRSGVQPSIEQIVQERVGRVGGSYRLHRRSSVG